MLTGDYNRAKKRGAPVYCGKVHAGLARRTNKSDAQLKEEKWWYDAFHRLFDADIIKQKKAEYFQKDYKANPDKYREQRKKKQPYQNEYCRQPGYKAYKHQYDVERWHKTNYGVFWEASILLMQLEKEIDIRLAKQENDIINKSQKRKRLWQKIQAKQNLSSLLQI